MKVFFSGIGGAGIGPLALIAHRAGFEVSGSDKQHSSYIDYLKSAGINNIYTGKQDAHYMPKDVDWYVYSSALPKEDPNHPELMYVRQNGIKHSKRDEFLNFFLKQNSLKMIAVAGTHGKTTTTAMLVWLFKQINTDISYLVPAKMSFASMSKYVKGSEFFIYECDEYDRNFLSFSPYVSIITGIDWDHPDVYPTRSEYEKAFYDFIGQSEYSVMYDTDFDLLNLKPANNLLALTAKDAKLSLAGEVNRADAWLVVQTVHELTGKPIEELVKYMNKFPGVSRRFEKIAKNIFTEYAHTPPKIRGALQLAHEVAGDNVVVVYEGLHNTRQHFIAKELATLFEGVKVLYVVPSYRAREDESLEDLTPVKLVELMQSPNNRQPALLNQDLRNKILQHANSGDTVLCISAGGGGSLDEWLRKELLSI